MKTIAAFPPALALLLLAAMAQTTQAQLIWQVGRDDNGWLGGDGGGPDATFVQEAGGINPLPGSPESTEANLGADNDYYFAGEYTLALPGVVSLYGDYAPVGTVAANEEAAERAFAAADNDLRYHFNLPTNLLPSSLLSVTFDALNLDDPVGDNTDVRYGIEVYFNGVLVQPEILIRPGQFGIDYTTPQFTLADVGGQTGAGADNIVSLVGKNYDGDGGGNWMGIDYVQLNQPETAIPAPVFPLAVGKDDNLWPSGNGGGENATFVRESGTSNPLPGSPVSTEVDGGADDDYYFAGDYSTAIAGNGAYAPVGVVPVNEEAAERGFAGSDNELRYHFNLPNTVVPTDLLAVTFDAHLLEAASATVTDPRYGVEVLVNGVLVQPAITIRPAQLNTDFATPSFTLASVGAQIGSGFDNIITLRGINHSATGGGNSMGIDFVQLNPATVVVPPAVLPWSVGKDDNGWPAGDGGGEEATFVQENGSANVLPGSPTSTEVAAGADDDYYLAGVYTTLVTGNGAYNPVGTVAVNEEASARGFAGADNTLRYHFNLPGSLTPSHLLSVTFAGLNLDTGVADARYGVEVYLNGVLVQPQIIIRSAQLGENFTTPQFTLASVNAQVGPGFDNIVTLKGIDFSATGGGTRLGIDFVKLDPHTPVAFPWAVGRDDNGWPPGDGGGENATFVQETGPTNLPGSPISTEVDQGADNDYYFAGIFTSTIPSVIAAYADYTPVGAVLNNEEAAERAFAGANLDLRYHFNLPTSLKPTDLLAVTFDANNLDDPLRDGGINNDLRFGIEVYFNGVQVQPEILIRPADLDTDYTTTPFTLASVGAEVGPGPDNIVSLRGISYNNEGGGNWMGIDYVKLDPVANPTGPPAFTSVVVSNGQVTLNWTGTGTLEHSSTLVPPWTPINPPPTPPYTEPVAPGGLRFYRLRRP